MLDATIHYRGEKTERRRLPAVPAVGSYILDGAPARRVWRVEAVVYGGKAVALYCVEVSARMAAELVEGWARWGEAAALDVDQGNGAGCGGVGCRCRHAMSTDETNQLTRRRKDR